MTESNDLPENPVAEDNLARLLARGYRPEAPDGDFVARVEAELAREAMGRRAARRTRWVAAAAAVIGAIAVGAVWKGTRPQGAGRDGPGSDVAGGDPEVPDVTISPGLLARDLPPPPDPVRATAGTRITTADRERRRLVLDDGSVLFVNAGTDVTVEADRRLRVAVGDVYVEVAPDATRPFVVATPQRDVTAVGTRFAVTVNGAATDVLVTHGAVKVGGASDLVRQGERFADAGDGKGRVEREPRAAEFLDWTRDLMAAAQSPLVPKSDFAGGAIVAIDPNGQEARLSLRKFHVDVHIEDGFARTTIDQTYFNHATWRMEGTFYFPLPPGASLSRLAMYVAGVRMEGGMTSRDRGREVYEQILRTRRDPALLEWVDGSTFKMRVFPLEPREEKRILLSYVERLPERAGAATYRFPAGHTLGFTGEWSFAGRVVGGAAAPWTCDSHGLAAKSEGGDLVLTASAKGEALAKDVVLRVGAATKPGTARFSTFEQDGHRYLLARFRPELAPQPLPKRRDWVFVVETSGGRDPVAARAQIEVVRALLSQAGKDDRFLLVAAGTTAKPLAKSWLPAEPTFAKAAIDFLEGTHLVGGLDLGAAFDAAREAMDGAENAVLVHVGTGVAVLGETDAAALAAKVPENATYVGVAVGRRAARPFLRAAAARTGGFWTQVQPDEPAAFRALEIAGEIDAPRLVGVSVAEDIGDVDPTKSPAVARLLPFDDTVSAGGEVAAVVRLDAKAPLPERIVVSGTLGGKPWSQALDVTNVPAGAGFLPREWARLEIERLLLEGAEKHKDAIVALSKAMYVISPFTSLLVLEDEAMYQQFEVDRGRKDHWALYPAPDKISVVKEPVSATTVPGTPAEVDRVLGTILVRLPRGLVQFGNEDWMRHSWGGQVWTVAQFLQNVEAQRQARGWDDWTFWTAGTTLTTASWDESAPRAASAIMTIAGGSTIDGDFLPLRNFTIGVGGGSGGGGGGASAAIGVGWGPFLRGGYRGPAGQVPPNSREPSDPPPPPVWIGGPSTPDGGGGPSGGPSLVDRLSRFRESNAKSSGEFFNRRNADDFRSRTENLFDLKRPSSGPRSFAREFSRRTLRESTVLIDSDFEGDGGLWFPRLPGIEGRSGGLRFRLEDPNAADGVSLRDEPATISALTLTLEADVSAWSVLSNLQNGQLWQTLQYRRPWWNQNADHARDLFSDLPAFLTTDDDVLAILEAEAGLPVETPGTIDDAARKLIERARALGFETVRFAATPGRPAIDVTADGAGRFRLVRTLRSGLREIAVADGKRLVHVYPDVALGAARTWNAHHDTALAALVPWHVPSIDVLARGADLRNGGDGIVSVVPRGESAWRIDLVFGADGRLAERRVVATKEGKTVKVGQVLGAVRYERTSDGVRIVAVAGGADTTELATLAVSPVETAPVLTPDAPGLTLLPMPWRTDEVVLKARGLDKQNRMDIAKWSEEDALAVATADRRNHALVAEVLVKRFFARGDVRPGLVALLLDAGVRFDADKPLDLGGVNALKLDPRTEEAGDLGRYLAAAAHADDAREFPSIGTGDAWIVRHAELVALLRKMRTFWSSPRQQPEREALFDRALDVAGRQDDPESRWAALNVAWNLGWPHKPQRVIEILEPLTKEPGWAYVARYERATALAQMGNAADGEKSDREFRALYDETLAAGLLPRIDGNFGSWMRGRDNPAYRAFFRGAAATLAERGRRDLVPYLSFQVASLGDAALSDALLASAVEEAKDDERATVLFSALEVSLQSGRGGTESYVRALVADPAANASPWVHRLAAVVFDRSGDAAAALAAEEKALDLEFRDLPDVVDLAAVRSSYGNVLGRLAQAAAGARALGAAPPPDAVARIVRVADRWRALDPDSSTPCLYAAKALRDLGRPDAAWAYATTPLDHRPNEAPPWTDLARHLRDAGDLPGADRAFERAFGLEPTDPGILWERAEALRAAGRHADAQTLYRQIVDGKWAPPYQQFVQMAQAFVR